MVVKIRLARFGRRRAPFYNIVVAQARFALLSQWLSFSSKAQLTSRTGQRETANRLKFLVCTPILQLHHQSFNQRLGSESRRNGRPGRGQEADEKTGTYDPIPKAPIDGEGKRWKDIKLDSARAKYWLGVGAQPSDPAWRLLSMVCSILNSGCVGEGLNWEHAIWLKRRYIWKEKQDKNAN